MRRHSTDRVRAAVFGAICGVVMLCVTELLGGCAWRSGGPAPCPPQPSQVGDDGRTARQGTPCEVRR